MTNMFKPKVATPKPTPTAPIAATPAVEAAAENERRRQRTAAGQAATMLTQGGMSPTANIGTTKLLGG